MELDCAANRTTAFQQGPPHYGPTACFNHNVLKVVIGVSADAIARRVVIRARVLLTHNRGHLRLASRAADTVNVSSTAWRSKLERLMTLSTSAAAVCCLSDSRSSLNSPAFSMAITTCSAR